MCGSVRFRLCKAHGHGDCCEAMHACVRDQDTSLNQLISVLFDFLMQQRLDLLVSRHSVVFV
jgi:hypothetical protein